MKRKTFQEWINSQIIIEAVLYEAADQPVKYLNAILNPVKKGDKIVLIPDSKYIKAVKRLNPNWLAVAVYEEGGVKRAMKWIRVEERDDQGNPLQYGKAVWKYFEPPEGAFSGDPVTNKDEIAKYEAGAVKTNRPFPDQYWQWYHKGEQQERVPPSQWLDLERESQKQAPYGGPVERDEKEIQGKKPVWSVDPDESDPKDPSKVVWKKKDLDTTRIERPAVAAQDQDFRDMVVCPKCRQQVSIINPLVSRKVNVRGKEKIVPIYREIGNPTTAPLQKGSCGHFFYADEATPLAYSAEIEAPEDDYRPRMPRAYKGGVTRHDDDIANIWSRQGASQEDLGDIDPSDWQR